KGGPSKMRGPLHDEALENKLLNGVREGSIGVSQDGRSSSQVNGMYATPPPGGTPMGDMEGQLDPAQVAEQAREEGGDDSDEGDPEEDQFLAEYDVAAGTLNGLTASTVLDEERIKELYAKPTPRPEYITAECYLTIDYLSWILDCDHRLVV